MLELRFAASLSRQSTLVAYLQQTKNPLSSIQMRVARSTCWLFYIQRVKTIYVIEDFQRNEDLNIVFGEPSGDALKMG